MNKKSSSNKRKNIGQGASLFIGRWQPFHKGHRDLIETVLKSGKPVVIAIRDTEISSDNPFTTTERWDMIQRALKKYSELVKIIVIPDIDEICYGRNVGYKIREIKLSSKVKKISGTKIRGEILKRHPVYWITGQSGAGKTTLAYAFQKEIGGIVLDGNEMRKSVSKGLGFSKDDREENNLRVARLALVISKQSPVIVSVIAPFENIRRKIDNLIKPIWIYIARTLPRDFSKPYEVPKNYQISLNSDIQTTKEQIVIILDYIKHQIN